MESPDMNLGYDLCEVRSGLSAEELWNVEKYFREQGLSEFVYDEQLDVLRFPEDGRFAICQEFADWERLQKLGYLHFYGASSIACLLTLVYPHPPPSLHQRHLSRRVRGLESVS